MGSTESTIKTPILMSQSNQSLFDMGNYIKVPVHDSDMSQNIQSVKLCECQMKNLLGRSVNIFHALVVVVLENGKMIASELEADHLGIIKISIFAFLGKIKAAVENYFNPLPRATLKTIFEMKEKFLKEKPATYDLTKNNCYHYAKVLLTGISNANPEFINRRLKNQKDKGIIKTIFRGTAGAFFILGGAATGGIAHLILGTLGGVSYFLSKVADEPVK